MEYVQRHFWRGHLRVLQVFLCALVSQIVCARTCTQLRGNADCTPSHVKIPIESSPECLLSPRNVRQTVTLGGSRVSLPEHYSRNDDHYTETSLSADSSLRRAFLTERNDTEQPPSRYSSVRVHR